MKVFFGTHFFTGKILTQLDKPANFKWSKCSPSAGDAARLAALGEKKTSSNWEEPGWEFLRGSSTKTTIVNPFSLFK